MATRGKLLKAGLIDLSEMKGYRRIEITAFRRRTILVDGSPLDVSNVSSDLSETETEVRVEVSPQEDCGLIIEAVRILEKQFSRKDSAGDKASDEL